MNSTLKRHYRELITEVETFINLRDRVTDLSTPINGDILNAQRESVVRLREHIATPLARLTMAKVQKPAPPPKVESDEGDW